MSADNFELYNTLGALIKNYRQWRRLSQETFAESIRMSVRQLRRWESNGEHARLESLHDLSETTGIPMQVCIALNADQPVWYSLQQRRFAFSSMETEFMFSELFTYRHSADNRLLVKCENISSDKHVNTILSCHREIYGSEKSLSKEVILAASRILPALNLIAFDSWGHYVGHDICLPITLDVYQQLKEEEFLEDTLTTGKIHDILALREGCFFHYSSFAVTLNTAHQIVIDCARYLATVEGKRNYLVAVYSPLVEVTKFFNHLGKQLVRDYESTLNEVRPRIHEVALDALMRHPSPWVAIRKKETPSDAGAARRKDRATGESGKDVINGPLMSGGPLIGCDQNKEACMNPLCALHGKSGQGNILSHGSRRTKGGATTYRFICKTCGKSFCSRRGSIFYDLRSSPKTVLLALKLLSEGVPLRGVARTLGVKRDTVRYWLTLASGQSSDIRDVLMKDLEVSPAELDALWNFVKNNSLRHRATLWKGAVRQLDQ